MLRCRFCDDYAVAVFHTPQGCVVYPNDRQQALCTHHAIRAQDGAPVLVLEDDLTEGKAFTKWWAK